MDVIALTTWHDRISPLFDSARTLTFVAPEGAREAIDISLLTLTDTAELLRRRHAQVLVCGAISRHPLALLLDRGIEVIPYVCGRVDDVCRALAEGELVSERFLLPGCSPMGRQCRSRCRGRRRHGRYHRHGAVSSYHSIGGDT